MDFCLYKNFMVKYKNFKWKVKCLEPISLAKSQALEVQVQMMLEHELERQMDRVRRIY